MGFKAGVLFLGSGSVCDVKSPFGPMLNFWVREHFLNLSFNLGVGAHYFGPYLTFKPEPEKGLSDFKLGLTFGKHTQF